MKKLLILLIMFMLTACSIDTSTDTDKGKNEAWARGLAPAGSEIIEYHKTQRDGNSYTYKPNTYVIFKFKNECFLMFKGFKRAALTNINCPKEQ